MHNMDNIDPAPQINLPGSSRFVRAFQPSVYRKSYTTSQRPREETAGGLGSTRNHYYVFGESKKYRPIPIEQDAQMMSCFITLQYVPGQKGAVTAGGLTHSHLL